MHRWGLELAGLQIDAPHPPGKVKVAIKQGQPVYDIVQSAVYDFIKVIDANRFVPDEIQILYHGLLAMRDSVSRQNILYLKA